MTLLWRRRTHGRAHDTSGDRQKPFSRYLQRCHANLPQLRGIKEKPDPSAPIPYLVSSAQEGYSKVSILLLILSRYLSENRTLASWVLVPASGAATSGSRRSCMHSRRPVANKPKFGYRTGALIAHTVQVCGPQCGVHGVCAASPATSHLPCVHTCQTVWSASHTNSDCVSASACVPVPACVPNGHSM